MKIWLDNEKPAPQGWVWVKTELDLLSILNAQLGTSHETCSGTVTIEEITHVSLDYELDPGCGDGIECAKIIAKGARDWAQSIRTSRDTRDIRFLGIQPMCVLCHSFSRDAKKEIDRLIGIAQEQWLVGLRELSVITAANLKDKVKV